MARPPKPWYRTGRDSWCVCYQGKLITLVKGKANHKEAYRRFLELVDGLDSPSTSRKSGQQVCRLFVEHARLNLKPNTHEGYRWFLEPFGKTVRSIDGNAVQPRHVTAFLALHPNWGKTTRFNAITAIKRAWKWANDEGHLTLDQVRRMKRPKPQRRDEIPDEREMAVFMKAASPQFRELLEFVHQTGCRLGEATMMEKRHVDLYHREVRFRIGEDKTSGMTDKPRVIHLNDAALAILTRLTGLYPSGKLFRNSRGTPWTRNAISCAVRRVRSLTGLDGRFVVTVLRHKWATDALALGVPIATVAEMLGNSPEIVARVYSHLSDKKALLLQAANAVRPPEQVKELVNGDPGTAVEVGKMC